MAHAQKPHFVFRRNGRVHLNRRRTSVQLTTVSRGVRISGSNAGYTMFRGSVKGTGYPLHSPVSPSLPLPCVPVCHHISTGLYTAAIFQFVRRTDDGLETRATLSDYCRGKRIFSNPKRVPAMGITRRPIPSVQCAISHRVKRPGRETDHTSFSS